MQPNVTQNDGVFINVKIFQYPTWAPCWYALPMTINYEKQMLILWKLSSI
jgi:hypothetical protein